MGLAKQSGSPAFALSATSGRVACRAWIDQRELKLSGQYRLRAAIECVEGVCSVYMPINFGSLGFMFEITEASGKVIDNPFGLAPHPFVPQLPLDSRNFVQLYAGMFVGASIEGQVQELFPKSGKYTLGLTYRAPVLAGEISSSEAALKDEAILREDGTIFAAPLIVSVQ